MGVLPDRHVDHCGRSWPTHGLHTCHDTPEIGRFRRRHLVPVPHVSTLAELNELITAAEREDDARHLPGRQLDIATEFAAERAALQQLPAEVFETGLTIWARVDQHARIRVRTAAYSVPARLAGRRLRVLLRADEVIVLDGRREVARHDRSAVKGSTILLLDHYLEVLVRKPGALPGATALTQARESGAFASEHEAFWAAARKALGDAAGTRELIEVLLLHRHLPREVVLAGLRAGLLVGSVRADVIAVEARRHHEHHAESHTENCTDAADEAGASSRAARVVSLTERRLTDPDATIASLPADHRPLPTVTAYDELLARRRDPHNPAARSSKAGEVS